MLGFHFLSITGFPLQFTYLSSLHSKGYPSYLKMIHAYLREYSDFLLGNCEKTQSGYLLMAGSVMYILFCFEHRNEKPKA